jgi:hypothetical protein
MKGRSPKMPIILGALLFWLALIVTAQGAAQDRAGQLSVGVTKAPETVANATLKGDGFPWL